MPEQYLLIDGNAPEPPLTPRMEDFADADGFPDIDAFFAALTESEEALDALPKQTAQDLEAQRQFLRSSLSAVLAGKEDGNALYSPLNLYLSLGLLTEITDGTAREQLLGALSAGDMSVLGHRLRAMWFSVHRNYGGSKCAMAASLWLNSSLSWRSDLLTRLADRYYVSSYLGEMGSEALDQALRSWLSAQTGGSLDAQASGIRLPKDAALALSATIDYRVPWTETFDEALTAPALFHAAAGDEEIDFMHRSDNGLLFGGERFSAVSLPLQNGGEMRFILPDEGVTPETLIHDSQLLDYLCHAPEAEWPEQKYLRINMAVPKFDVSCDLTLASSLQQMGVTAVFRPDLADFSPIMQGAQSIALSQVLHAARVQVDEEGVAASAYTVMMATLGMIMPEEEETDFVLDRPFLFELLGEDGSILFVGVVSNP